MTTKASAAALPMHHVSPFSNQNVMLLVDKIQKLDEERSGVSNISKLEKEVNDLQQKLCSLKPATFYARERLLIQKQIQKISNEIQNIKNGQLLLKTQLQPLLEQHVHMKNNDVDLANNINNNMNTSSLQNSDLFHLMQSVVDPESVPVQMVNQDFCRQCGAIMHIHNTTSQLICTNSQCASSTRYFHTSNVSTSTDHTVEMVSKHDPEDVYDKWIAQYEDSPPTPNDVLLLIRSDFETSYTQSTKCIRPTKVKNSIRKHGLSAHIHRYCRIARELNNEPIPIFTKEQVQICRRRFRVLRQAFRVVSQQRMMKSTSSTLINSKSSAASSSPSMEWEDKNPNIPRMENTTQNFCYEEGWLDKAALFARHKSRNVNNDAERMYAAVKQYLAKNPQVAGGFTWNQNVIYY